MIEITEGRISSHPPKQSRVMRARKVYKSREGCNFQRFAEMPFHKLNALGNLLTNAGRPVSVFLLMAQKQTHQVSQGMGCVNQMRQRKSMFERFYNFLK